MDVELEEGELSTLFITSLKMVGLLSQKAMVIFASVTYFWKAWMTAFSLLLNPGEWRVLVQLSPLHARHQGGARDRHLD